MKAIFRVWRQRGPRDAGGFVRYTVDDLSPAMTLLEALDRLNEALVTQGEPPVGYLRGRNYFRDVIALELKCSDVDAEKLVDTLEMNGYLHFEGDPSQRSHADSRWSVLPHVP